MNKRNRGVTLPDLFAIGVLLLGIGCTVVTVVYIAAYLVKYW